MSPVKEIVATIMIGLLAIIGVLTEETKRNTPDCVRTCEGLPNGFYASCDGYKVFMSCSDETMTIVKCPHGMEWDGAEQTCNPRSNNMFFQHSTENPIVNTAAQEELKGQDYEKLLSKRLKDRITQKTPPNQNPQVTLERAVESELKVFNSEKPSSGSRFTLHGETAKHTVSLNFPGNKSDVEHSRPFDLNVNNLRGLNYLWKISHQSQNKDHGGQNQVSKVMKMPRVMGQTLLSSPILVKPNHPSDDLKDTLKPSTLALNKEIISEKYYILPPNETNFAGDCLFRENEVVTFDGETVKLSGNCKYVAAQVHNKTELSVEVQLRASPDSAEEIRSVVDYVDITVKNRWVRLHSVGLAFADGIMVSPGRKVVNTDYTALTGPDFSLLQTANGVIGTLDREHRFILYLPSNYSDRVMGLCGTPVGVRPSTWKTLDQHNPGCSGNSPGKPTSTKTPT